MCQAKSENLIGRMKEITERWTEYFKELLNVKKLDVTHSEHIYYGPEIFIQYHGWFAR